MRPKVSGRERMTMTDARHEDGDAIVPTRLKSAMTGSLAEKMMKSMGWKEGQGLGKNNEGIVKHVTVERRLDGQGLGLELDNGGNSAFGTTATGFSNALAALSAKYGAPEDDADSSDESDSDESEPRRTVKRTKKFVAPRGHHKKKDLKTVASSDMKAILGTASSGSQAGAGETGGETAPTPKKSKKTSKKRAAEEDASSDAAPVVEERPKRRKTKDEDDAAAAAAAKAEKKKRKAEKKARKARKAAKE